MLIKNVASETCLAADPIEAGSITLRQCVAGPDTLWYPLCSPNNSVVFAEWQCFSRSSPAPPPPPPSPQHPLSVVTVPCSKTNATWADFEGFWMPGAVDVGDGPGGDGQCLQIATGSPFCDATVCPKNFASPFKSGMGLVTSSCLDGDRSQMIGAFTVPTESKPTSRQNLIPLTWAVSAYVGNGLLGVRVQSEEGGVGVLHVLVRAALFTNSYQSLAHDQLMGCAFSSRWTTLNWGLRASDSRMDTFDSLLLMNRWVRFEFNCSSTCTSRSSLATCPRRTES